ncbi:MAG: TolC family protein, partial [Candidatus Acidiferrales bacterium]
MESKPVACAKMILAAILAASLFTGCKVGPNYKRPTVQVPSTYRDFNPNPQAEAQAASFADLPWWQVFQDPVLQDLIKTALKQNYDLQTATERIIAARAQLAVTRSSLFPQVQGDANFTGGKEQNFQSKSNFLALTADASFQLDLFGKLRRETEAARAQVLA